MLRSYITIALRNLWKYKGFTAINFLGLSVGVAVCLLIVAYVRLEWSYDQFHEQADRLHRAWVLEDYGEDQRFFNTTTPIPLGPALKNSLPEVERSIRISTFSTQVQKGNLTFTETIHLADPEFFDVFSFPLQGTITNPLDNTHTVVLTPQLATRYFGETNPVGQTLTLRIGERDQEFVVTAVTDVIPRNSSIQFSMVVPWRVSLDVYDDRQRRSWGNVIAETYVLLQEGTDLTGLEAKFPSLVEHHVGQIQDGSYTIGLQPITDIHLNPSFPQGLAAVSDPAYSYILSVLAFFVLGIACINVITLSAASSTSRNIEVGVRKVMGAGRRRLMQQFFGESIALALLAATGGVLLAWVGHSFFEDLTGTQDALHFDAGALLSLFILVCVIGGIAGSYPALVLSAFRIVDVFKGTLPTGNKGGFLRQSLIVVQFAFAVFLISSTLIMNRQLEFLQTKNLGFDKEQVLVVPLQGAVSAGSSGGLNGMNGRIDAGMEAAKRFKQELAQQSHVVQTGAASFVPGVSSWFDLGYYSDDGRFLKFQMNVVDPDFLGALDMQLVAGRNFAGYGTADANRGIIINETLAAFYNWEDPIGQRLPGPFGDHEIIGVVRDFHYQSLHTAIEPAILVMNMEPIMAGIMDVTVNSSPIPKLFVRILPGRTPEALAALEGIWNRLADGQSFTFSFLDENIDSQYRAEQLLRKLAVVVTLLAILIACLGLFGQAALTTARRKKEIGIRKIVGASSLGIVFLLSKDFVRLVLIAFIVVTPVVYLVMNRWLQDFAYRITIGPGVFILVGMLCMALALLTVSYQSLNAALKNPVDSLRYE
ncbi:MAG: ABC transporter permease [Rhodothermaceae bacterium]|nr:ABC transporter permease [Rhodothermaceae bacterium]